MRSRSDSAKPTFENTIVALERTGQALNRVNAVFSNLTNANTNPALQKIEADIAPKLAAHNDAVLLNSALFARVHALYEQRDKLGLDPESLWLLERYHKDFVHAGAQLSDSDKEKLKALNGEIATVQITFEQNVLKEKNASSIVVDQRDGAGRPPRKSNRSRSRGGEGGKERRQVRPAADEHHQPAGLEFAGKSRAARAHHADFAGAQQPRRRVR